MNGNCHFVFGTACGACTALRLEELNGYLGVFPEDSDFQLLRIACVSLFILGSLFPDVDNPNSHIGDITRPFSTVVKKINRMFGKRGARHRTVPHDLVTYILLARLAYLYSPAMLFFCMGAGTHLYLDLFTPYGIPVLGKSVSISKINSESKEAVKFTYIHVIAVIVITAIGVISRELL